MQFLKTLAAATLGTLLAAGIIFFFLLVSILVLAASDSGTPVQKNSVLVLNLSGEIPEMTSDDPLDRALTGNSAVDLQGLRTALRNAAADDRIKGVLIKPSGIATGWAGLEELRAALVTFKKSGKPLIAHIGDTGSDEADYYIASAADSVYAAPLGMFEFNGFAVDVLFYKDMLDKLEVKPEIIRAGKFKAAVEPFLRNDLSPENREQLQAMITVINNQFLSAVSASRKVPVAMLQTIAAERPVFSAEEALRARLIDGLRYSDQVEAGLKKRLGIDVDDDLNTIGIKDYVQVPASQAGVKEGSDGEVAVVYAVGQMMPGKSTRGTLGSETLAKALREARDRDDIKAVVLRIDSPGGFAPAAEKMLREVHLTAAKKPLVISMGGYAASGGYWIATSGNTIVADATTITGSIGAFALLFDAQGLLNNKLGITTDGVATSPYADMMSGLKPLSEGERALMQRFIDTTYRGFVQKVATARKMTPAQVDSIAQGRVWMGADAKRIGLVDEIGGLDRAIAIAASRAKLKEGSYRITELPVPPTFLEELTENLEARAMAAFTSFRTTPAERLATEAYGRIRQLAAESGAVQVRLPFQLVIH